MRRSFRPGAKPDITRFERLTMMTPMLVQYLVGLCCLRNDPDAVDVTVGDLVLDRQQINVAM